MEEKKPNMQEMNPEEMGQVSGGSRGGQIVKWVQDKARPSDDKRARKEREAYYQEVRRTVEENHQRVVQEQQEIEEKLREINLQRHEEIVNSLKA